MLDLLLEEQEEYLKKKAEADAAQAVPAPEPTPTSVVIARENQLDGRESISAIKDQYQANQEQEWVDAHA